MRYHLANARFLEREVEGSQVSSHPLAALLDDLFERLLVLTRGHGDQLVGGGRGQVVAEESMLLTQLIGPAVVDHLHHLVTLTWVDFIPPNAHEHSCASWVWISTSMR